MTEALDAILQWYSYACDSLTLAARQVRTGQESIPASVVSLRFAPMDTALAALANARAELDDLTVLALFAVFEQALLDDLAATSRQVQARTTTRLEGSLASRALRDIDRWPLDDVLDVYKAVVRPDLVGLVKQVKAYRDWVAHRKKGRPDALVHPAMAYDRLSGFLRALA